MIEDTVLEFIKGTLNYTQIMNHFQLPVQPLQVTGNVRENIKMPLYILTFKHKFRLTKKPICKKSYNI